MNTSLICTECGKLLNDAHILFQLMSYKKQLNKRQLNKQQLNNNIDIMKKLNITEDCCKKQVFTVKINDNMINYLEDIKYNLDKYLELKKIK